MSLKEYKPGQAFSGVIGRTFDVSQPAWPAPNRAREGAPNVLFIVLDDTGFGHLGCYGSPINTPNLDALAADGLRYNNMHTTALCSPSRSCMLTGRNHHSNGMACITEGSTGYPGGNGYIPFENGMLSEILLQHGYNTYAIGKWHLTPAEATSAAGPYDRWPLGRGFERYYGFLGGDTHQYYPELVRDNTPDRAGEDAGRGLPPHARPGREGQGDDRRRQAGRAQQAVLHVLLHRRHARAAPRAEGVGRQVQGQVRRRLGRLPRAGVREAEGSWASCPQNTTLSRHDPDVQDWDKLPADERRLYARMMEVFAGFLEHTDHYIGELIAFLKEHGRIREHPDHGDLRQRRQRRGRSERLGERRQVLQQRARRPASRTWPRSTTSADRSTSTTTPGAGPTPATRRSGAGSARPIAAASRIPFIVTWPKGIKARGEIRTQYCHAIDMVPTVLDALGIEPPTQIRGVTQSPLAGLQPEVVLRRRQGARAARHPVLRDVRPPLALSRRLARRLSVARHLVHRVRPVLRRADRLRQAHRARCQGLGALQPQRGLRRDQQPRRRRSATG